MEDPLSSAWSTLTVPPVGSNFGRSWGLANGGRVFLAALMPYRYR